MVLEQRRKEFLELHSDSEEGKGKEPLTPTTEIAKNEVPGVGGEGSLKNDAATDGVSVTDPISTAGTSGATGRTNNGKLGKGKVGDESPWGEP